MEVMVIASSLSITGSRTGDLAYLLMEILNLNELETLGLGKLAHSISK